VHNCSPGFAFPASTRLTARDVRRNRFLPLLKASAPICNTASSSTRIDKGGGIMGWNMLGLVVAGCERQDKTGLGDDK
jgi:hypothetical protein